MFAKVKAAYDANQKYADFLKKAATVASYASAANSIMVALTSNYSSLTAEDIIRVSAQVAALADPTGVFSVVAAYTYPRCSQVAP